MKFIFEPTYPYQIMKRKTLPFLLKVVMVVFACYIFSACKEDETPAPAIASVNPTSGYPGTLVTITGTSFNAGEGNIVRFNSKDAVVVSSSSTEIIAKVPEDAGTGEVIITTRGTQVSGGVFTYKSYPALTVTNPTYVTPFDATLNGQLSVLGTEAINDHGFIYGLSEIKSVTEGTKISLG